VVGDITGYSRRPEASIVGHETSEVTGVISLQTQKKNSPDGENGIIARHVPQTDCNALWGFPNERDGLDFQPRV
jgi:hypothetical protein